MCYADIDEVERAIECYKESLAIVNDYNIQELKMDLLICLSAIDLKATQENNLCSKKSFKSLKDLDEGAKQEAQPDNEYFKAYKYAMQIKNEGAQVECKINFGIAQGDDTFSNFKKSFKF